MDVAVDLKIKEQLPDKKTDGKTEEHVNYLTRCVGSKLEHVIPE
jgi:hypothetical protein